MLPDKVEGETLKESEFVAEAMVAAREILSSPLSIERGASLLYEVAVDHRLELTVDPKAPRRGRSAFETDLCVFEEVAEGVRIPRVVLEFKPGITTHDVITYSVKARRHKQVYPYLRYGLVIGNRSDIPGRVFKHNEALDFVVAAAAFANQRLHEIMASVLREEIEASRTLERITVGECEAYLFRTSVDVREGGGKLR